MNSYSKIAQFNWECAYAGIYEWLLEAMHEVNKFIIQISLSLDIAQFPIFLYIFIYVYFITGGNYIS
jgi:hypothetical protein